MVAIVCLCASPSLCLRPCALVYVWVCVFLCFILVFMPYHPIHWWCMHTRTQCTRLVRVRIFWIWVCVRAYACVCLLVFVCVSACVWVCFLFILHFRHVHFPVLRCTSSFARATPLAIVICAVVCMRMCNVYCGIFICGGTFTLAMQCRDKCPCARHTACVWKARICYPVFPFALSPSRRTLLQIYLIPEKMFKKIVFVQNEFDFTSKWPVVYLFDLCFFEISSTVEINWRELQQ